MDEFEDLKPDETKLIGAWVMVDGEIDGNSACLRVQFLINERLVKMGASKDSGAWETLFRDPNDDRYWERTYPNGNWHGGGPPALINLSEKDARAKYPALFTE